MGILQKTGNFLGVSKFGQGLATAGRVISGQVRKDIAKQESNTEKLNKLMYAYKKETNPIKKKKLLELAVSQGKLGNELSASNIDPGLNLSNKEIIGSAANVGLNILTPGAFKGGKATIIGKNALLGAGFGMASGLEKNRSAKGILGSTIGGAIVGGSIGIANVGLRALKDFTTKATPKWLMDKAIKPTLDESRKTIKYGQKTLGEELLQEGVKGSPKKLLEIANSKLNSLEDDLQRVLTNPSLGEARINKAQLVPYMDDLIKTKSGIPGLGGDVKRIKNILDSIPEQLSLPEANIMKRRIYNELRDVSYKLDAKLGLKANVLKKLASGLKQEIENEVGGTIVKDINQKLSLYGRLENRIVDQMARSMKNNSFGLTDAILTSGGLATMNPLGILAGLSAAGVKNAASSTGFRTSLAQGLNKLGAVGTGKTAQTLQGGIKRGILNIP